MLRRAVFSDYQRKGLEKRFQIQKYISKPDRKKLAEKLGLKDSQVSTYIFLNCFLFLTHCAKNPLMSHLKNPNQVWLWFKWLRFLLILFWIISLSTSSFLQKCFFWWFHYFWMSAFSIKFDRLSLWFKMKPLCKESFLIFEKKKSN